MSKSISIGQTKRFLERWSSDPSFKALVMEEPEKAVSTYNIGFHPKEIQLLWDSKLAVATTDTIPCAVQEYRKFINTKFSHRDHLRDDGQSSNQKINAWRKRQMMRCISQLGPAKHGSIVHSPFAVELSNGCSVGCWFCAYSAPKLSALFRYSDTNRILWRDTLDTLREVWGESAKYGFCYWATEPLDNPDYEKFILDFHKILGYFPQTTTATPLANIERTKRLIALSREKDGFVERFSIHSLEKLEKVYENFTPDELQWVELVTQNEESDMAYANSGKILEGGNEKEHGQVVVSDSTIACVSGFLLNMVNQSVQLITPCISDKRWPKGYIIYDEAHFKDGEDLQHVLNNMIADHMPLTIEQSKLVEFRHDLDVVLDKNGFSLNLKKPSYSAAPHPVHNAKDQVLFPELRELGKRIGERKYTARELAQYFEDNHFIAPAETFHCLNTIFSFGLLHEGPV